MLVARYFLYVGGALLALLFAIDAFMPQDAATESHGAPGLERSTVRIHSAQKLPEKVVYDTSLPTIVPLAPATQVAAAPAPAQVSAEARVRETFAQFVPAEAKKEAKHTEPQARKRRVARVRTGPPMGQPLRVAQQWHFGFFGGPGW
jgi:hypothetical protein